MRNERPDPIDALIDSAARQLVAGEPSSSLRSAVRNRVERRRPISGLELAWGAAAVVLVVTAIAGSGLFAPEDTGAKRASVAPVVETPAPERIERSERPERPERPGRSERSERLERLERSEGPRRRLAAEVMPPALEEESPIPPLTIEPIATVQIAVDVSSGVMPMEIEPLQIEPLLSE